MGKLPPRIQALLDNKINRNQIGLVGHSFGGVVALHMSFQDPRIKAGMNIDGSYTYLNFLNKSLEIPFMFFYSTNNLGINEDRLNDFWFLNSQAPVYSLAIKGTSHLDNSDITVFSSFLKKIRLLSPIDGRKMLSIVSKYVVAFFDRHLKKIDNENSILLSKQPSPFPEVSFEPRNV